MRPRLLVAIALAAAASACSAESVPIGDVPALPTTTPAEVHALLDASTLPVVLNVWASWCGPCRSEAPLLRSAAAESGDTVRFIGIDVRDTQDGARGFIAEFGLDGIEHYIDASGAVPNDLGGRGVPITFFFAPGGRLVSMHSGVLDERSLALGIDEISRTVP